jgi:uncharacterized protein (TIRG00374 family)
MMKIIKIVISLALLALLAFKLDWVSVAHSASRLAWWALPTALVVQVLVLVIANLRWWVLLRTHRLGHTRRELLPQYFIGAFFNNLLPTSTGGDLFRMYYIFRQQHGSAIAVSPVITERLLGLATMIGIAALVVPFARQDHQIIRLLSHTLPWIFVIAIAGLALLGSRFTYRPLHNFFQRWERYRAVGALLHIAEASHQYINRPVIVIKLVLMSICIQLLEVVVFMSLGDGMGANMEVTSYLVTVPVVFFAASAPVSIGGWGVREAVAVALFSAAGMSQAHAATVAVLFIPVLLLSSVPGLIFFLRTKNHKDLYERASHSDLSI